MNVFQRMLFQAINLYLTLDITYAISISLTN